MKPAIMNPAIVRFLLVTAAFFGLAALAIEAASVPDGHGADPSGNRRMALVAMR